MKRLKANLISVNIGQPQPLVGLGKTVITSINKTSVDGEIFLSKLNLEGDEQADKKNHGGLDKAVCAYPYEHYPFWEQELGNKLPLGAFGENLTLKGLEENNVHIGDVFQWGQAVIQVSQPRIPCHKLAKRLGNEDTPQCVIDKSYTGFYFRVLKEGTVSVTTPLHFLKRCTDYSVSFVNNNFHHDRYNEKVIEELLAVEELAASWRSMLRGHLEKILEKQ
ncbi:MOSC domain-containing protein YiiM [Evansella vedderi]|uniref:MOSC domain-containing protein YiiM n=1 Tax=Evansella vedderi TaxID=38282 RepID=A0ABT9ZRX1_9BACI|nr:MOSC domain-containing protein [Evansella vedderi]MDQ0253980.1 MOSC domain-containing protein YiiM [Evansella vedderi]